MATHVREDPTTIDPAAAAVALWAFRARAELEAAARFDRIAGELDAALAPASVVDLARKAGDDERRHHRLCADLVRHFGGEPPEASAAARPLAAGHSDRRRKVLYEVVAMSCVTESLSTALLIAMRAEATDVEVRRVVHSILVDEVDHARIGWAYLAFASRRDSCAFLGPRLPAMLAATVNEEIFDLDDAEADVATTGLGGLVRSSRRSIFVDTMRDVVFPGLQQFGVDTKAARSWLDDRRPR